MVKSVTFHVISGVVSYKSGLIYKILPLPDSNICWPTNCRIWVFRCFCWFCIHSRCDYWLFNF
jgi:hypothetical protein